MVFGGKELLSQGRWLIPCSLWSARTSRSVHVHGRGCALEGDQICKAAHLCLILRLVVHAF